jgi:DNA-binding response OmpR family regulator
MAHRRAMLPLNKTYSSISLNRSAPSQPAILPSEETPINLRTAHPAILIVDDDPDILTALHDLVEHDGFRVTEVSTCRDALEQVRAVKFAAVLLDIGLPDGDGLAVLTIIQTVAPSLPVIVLTAFASQDCRARSLSSGAFFYLTKPYNRDELRAVLRRALEASHPPTPSDN